MLISEVLEKKQKQGVSTVFAANEDTSAFHAIAKLKENGIGSLLIMSEKSTLIGILSEKDILYKCYNSNVPLRERKVKDIMTPVDDLVIVTMEDTTDYLRNVMTNRRIRHVPVLNKSNEIEGVVSLGDLVKAELDEAEEEAKLLREHIQNPFGIHLYGQQE